MASLWPQVHGAASARCGKGFSPPPVSWTGHTEKKCEFAVPEIQFLGHHVTGGGIRPLADRVKAIQDHPKPATVKQLQAFLRAVNCYHRFVPPVKNPAAPYGLTEGKGGLKAWQSFTFFKKVEPTQLRQSCMVLLEMSAGDAE
jgi:hypothetical protein